jgi:hypothetical protein
VPPRIRFAAALLAALLACAQRAAAQSSDVAQGFSPASAPVAQGVNPANEITLSGSIRTRAYSWNWFGADSSGEYAYPAVLVRAAAAQSRPRMDWMAEIAAPFVFHLPHDAVAPAPRGQLGLGANYFAANDNSADNGSLFLKQGFVRVKALGGNPRQSIRLGRFEVNDGTDAMPSNATLAALRRDRIGQRLVGAFGFSDVGRSLDGAEYTTGARGMNVTVWGGRPTQGVFDVEGWPELKINLIYGAATAQIGRRSPGEWRLFALVYDDRRHLAGKTDNRPAAIRNAETAGVTITTAGGHYTRIVDTAAGQVDVLFWTALQIGSWGPLTHRAGAFAAEAGWQPPVVRRLRPWIRGGFDYGSGDGDSGDRTHGTFFQVLPTPRIYARLPFFNMMNTRDAFATLIGRPAAALTFRADVHALHLADAHDLWYSGGGAFESTTFGYAGRPANGNTGLATLYDVSVDWTTARHLGIAGYIAHADGGPIVRSIYGVDDAVRFGYVEATVRF